MVLGEEEPAGPWLSRIAMARLTESQTLAKLPHALSQWQFTGYITWKPIARQWLEQNLEGFTTRSVGEEMWRFFAAGGEIDEVRESRPEWSGHRFHYDFRIDIGGRFLYIETILMKDAPDDPTIHVVSIHDA
jgi:hypothetical protein